MSYIEGFVIAVPIANKAAFIAHANEVDQFFLDHGAIRVVECWADDVPRGTLTDFYRAVDAREGEAIAFSWIEWPDKATYEANRAKFHALMESDPRFNPKTNPPPFDGKRMIVGGFSTVVSLGE